MIKSATRDDALMQAALTLARRGLGRVWPNPAVGCVIVRDGQVVGRGWTQPGGRPHAETEALHQAGAAAQGATAYVTLEPCNHHGRTPPCTDALIAAGVARVVVAIEDPDPRVEGRGLARLRDAGIAVELGLRASEAAELNAGFFLKITLGRPLVAVKMATSLDGRIATHTGQSQWITGHDARAYGHLLRAQHDAILIGSGTALADDPALTCRLAGLEQRSPVRVIVDSRLRTPLTSALVRGARQVPTWVLTREDAARDRIAAYRDAGVVVTPFPAGDDGSLDLSAALKHLATAGITRLLVEGGGAVIAGLLRADLVDRLYHFRAALAIGGDGIAAIAGYGIDRLTQAARFVRDGVVSLGEDCLETYHIER